MPADPSIVSALAEILIRRCLGRALPGDGELVRALALSIGHDAGDALDNDTGSSETVDSDGVDLFAVGSIGSWAGFGPDGQLDTDTIHTIVDLCRGLLRTHLAVEERALVSAALGLLAARGVTNLPGVDFVNVATSARTVEQHELALWAARRALDAGEDLTQSHRALALLTVAVITHDADAIREAYAVADQLESGDIAAKAANALAPTLRHGAAMTAVGHSVRARDRRSAAGALLAEFDELRDGGDDLVLGLIEVFAALAEQNIDVERARRGLTRIVAHLRGRQRFGEVPPVARSGVDMVADLLALDTNPAAANLLTEFVEALTDAGLSEVSALPDEGVPAVVQARLAYLAQKSPIWTDLASCIAGLRGRSALMIREQRLLSTGGSTFLALFITPPDGLAVKSVRLDGPTALTLRRLTAATPAALGEVRVAELDQLIAEFLPRALIDGAVAGDLSSLLVVPDGPAWTIPWQAAGLLADVDVTLAPSLGVHARVPADPGQVESITAVIDPDAPAAEIVEDALLDARARGVDVHLPRTLEATSRGELLIMFTHGGGTGLSFTAGDGQRPLPALLLAASRFRQVLVAACWSSAAPPKAYPINLPSALQLTGAATVVGGLWPLPAADTAEIVAGIVSRVAAGTGMRAALRHARGDVSDAVVARWGLAVHGGPASP